MNGCERMTILSRSGEGKMYLARQKNGDLVSEKELIEEPGNYDLISFKQGDFNSAMVIPKGANHANIIIL